MKGKFWGIGLGPGEEGWVTLQAARLLQSCDLIMVPRAGEKKESAALKIVRKMVDMSRVEERVFPMSRDHRALKKAYHQLAVEIAASVCTGKKVAFLTIGDPLTYSTFNYLLQELKGILKMEEIEVVPGVTSFSAACARAAFPLLLGDEKMAVIPWSRCGAEEIKELVQGVEVVVFMKIGKRLSELLDFLAVEMPDAELNFASHLGSEMEVLCSNPREIKAESGYMSVLIARKNRGES